MKASLEQVAECLYRNHRGAYFALAKVCGKQIKRSLRSAVLFWQSFTAVRRTNPQQKEGLIFGVRRVHLKKQRMASRVNFS
jgi:hypothetical protein